MLKPALSQVPSANDSYAVKTVQNVAWLGGTQFIRQFMAIGTTVVLARFLTPSDYGIFAMTLFVNELAQMFIDFGIGSALVQRKQVDARLLSTCFWINLAIGTAVALLVIVAGPVTADVSMPAQWAEESCRIVAAAGFYPSGHQIGADPFRPDVRDSHAAGDIGQLLRREDGQLARIPYRGSALVLLHHAAVGFPDESAVTVALDAGEAQDQRRAFGLFQAGLSVGAGQKPCGTASEGGFGQKLGQWCNSRK